jgi:BirA family biotin operon repressor/biotin-[acetyl-CoA-carboxylase] ligase
MTENNILSGILPFLNIKETAEKIEFFSSLESTNKTAKEAAVMGAKHGTVIIADSQTAGKGRYNRRFHSPAGSGIYMSVILRPSSQNGVISENPTLITAYAALSVCQAIESATGKSPQIKWVNDVFYNGKKICGILTESGNTRWFTVGIGINLTVPKGGFPEEIRETAGALFGGELQADRSAAVKNRIIAEIINEMLEFETKYDKQTLLNEYKKRLMTLGKRVTVSITGEERFEAAALDVDENGGLIAEKDGGELITLCSGEVSILY